MARPSTERSACARAHNEAMLDWFARYVLGD